MNTFLKFDLFEHAPDNAIGVLMDKRDGVCTYVRQFCSEDNRNFNVKPLWLVMGAPRHYKKSQYEWVEF